MGKLCNANRCMDVDVEICELDNGLRVLYMPIRNVGITYVQLGTRMGMDAEDSPGLLESAHAIEHMLGCMTSSRHPDAKKMSEDMDMRGIKSNATTTRETVTYWMKGLREHSDWMIEAITDSYVNPRMDSKVFKQEMLAVSQELRSDIADTWHPLEMSVYKTMFKGLPISVDTKTKLDNVSKLRLPFLRKLRKKWYQPQLVTMYLAGAVNRKQLARAKARLSIVEPGETRSPDEPEVHRPWGTIVRVRLQTKSSNTGCRMLFPVTLDLFDYKKALIIDMIDFILSNGFSSRLYRELRTKMGAVYSITFRTISSTNPKNSFVSIATECEDKNLASVVEATLAICRRLINCPPTTREMRKWRDHVRMHTLEDSLCTDPSDFVGDYDAYLLWANKYPKNSYIRKVALDIKPRDAKEVAREMFGNDCIVFHTGSKQNDAKIKKFLQR